VYVGGYPSVWVGGTPAPYAEYLARWSGTSWSSLGNFITGGLPGDNQVTSIAVSGNNVYVGGYFANAGGIPNTNHIAKWNTLTETWSALRNGVSGGIVEVIKFQGSDLYVGGGFTTVYDGLDLVPEATYLAKWNGSTWSGVGTNGAAPGGPLNGGVLGLATDGTNLYVNGYFQDINNSPYAK